MNPHMGSVGAALRAKANPKQSERARRRMVDALHPGLLAAAAHAQQGDLLPGGTDYTPPHMDDVVGCATCKRRKKCRAGHKCANYDSCGNILQHGKIYGGNGSVGSGKYCANSECKGLAGVPISLAICKRRLGYESARCPERQPLPPKPPPPAAVAAAAPPKEAPPSDEWPDDEWLDEDGSSVIVHNVLGVRACRDAGHYRNHLQINPDYLANITPGVGDGAPLRYLVVADFIGADAQPKLQNGLKWMTKADLLAKSADRAACEEELDYFHATVGSVS